MDFKRESSPIILFATPPPLDSLKGITVYLDNYSQISQAASKFQPQVIKCREFIFTEPDVIGTPSPDIRQTSFHLVAKNTFWKNGRLLSRLEKMKLDVSQLFHVTPALYQACLKYTLQARIAPTWNKAGQWLIQGRDFLTHSGYANAVKMDLVVNENELFFTLEATAVKFTALKVEDLDIVGKGLKTFLENPQAEIQQHSIASDWCFVLPSMKKGRIQSISHDLPEESPFRSYRDIKRHWKNTYGYRLPEVEEGMNFYQVQFGPLGGRQFTYPEVCLRSRDIQLISRIDPKPILRSFMLDIQAKFPTVCECPLKLQSKAKFAVSILSESCKVQQNTQANLTSRLTTARPAIYRSKDELDNMISNSHSQKKLLNTANTAPSSHQTNSTPGASHGTPPQKLTTVYTAGTGRTQTNSNTKPLSTSQHNIVHSASASQQPSSQRTNDTSMCNPTKLQPHRADTPIASGKSLMVVTKQTETGCPRKIIPTFKPKRALQLDQIRPTQTSSCTSGPRTVPQFGVKKVTFQSNTSQMDVKNTTKPKKRVPTVAGQKKTTYKRKATTEPMAEKNVQKKIHKSLKNSEP